MHNLINYDVHLFMKELGKYSGKSNIIAENSEKCISISQNFNVGQYWNRAREKSVLYNSSIKISLIFTDLSQVL